MAQSSTIRAPAVAGTFYPAAAIALAQEVDSLLQASHPAPHAPKAIIAPHAGYIYSGPIAAAAYACLASSRTTVRRVILLGPAHRLPFRGLALPGAAAFRTPLGDIAVDRDAVERVRHLPGVSVIDAAYNGEHCIEVHLPFLQRALERFTLVPAIVGDAKPEDVARFLDELWGGPETLIVISSDLSHSYECAAAKTRDAETASAIEHLDARGLDEESACGRIPIKGLLAVAARRGLTCSRLDLRNSGDTAGPRDQVVGYGAWAFA